jgi:purine-binding chemotaxis protein CheW
MEIYTLLTFKIGTETFAVNVINVLEVLEKQHITKIPQTPTHILGIINFRGNILPVFDTRQKFNLPPISIEDKNYIIVYEINHNDSCYTIAATADSVKDVIEITSDDIKSVPEIGLNFNTKYISGAIRKNDQFILLTNIENIFSLSETETLKALDIEN